MDFAERIASELGYVALACDLHGNRKILSSDESRDVLAPLRAPGGFRARTHEPLRALVNEADVDPARVAAVGFCIGGTMALQLALDGVGLKAAVGFHCGLQFTIAPETLPNDAQLMALIGADDPAAPPEQRLALERQLTQAGIDWQMMLYGGVVHSYTQKDAAKLGKPELARYDAKADRRSWQEMAMLLAEVFAPI